MTMNFFQKTSVLLTVFSVIASQAQHTDLINTNRPGESQSAYSVGRNVWQIETGVYGLHDKHELMRYTANGFGGTADLRFGYFKEELEFIAQWNYRIDVYEAPLLRTTRSGTNAMLLGAKYLFFDPYKRLEEKQNIYSWKANQKFNWKDLIPALSVYVGANIDINSPYTFDSDPFVSPKVMLITQNTINRKWSVISNIFYDKFTTEFPSYGGILTVTRGIHARLSVFLEGKAIQSDFYADGVFTGGAAYLVSENIQMDAFVSKNYKNTPNLIFGGIGMSWRFDQKYNPYMIPLETEKEKEDAKKKKEQKVNKKSDEIEIDEDGNIILREGKNQDKGSGKSKRRKNKKN
jgi:hypothetical protein